MNALPIIFLTAATAASGIVHAQEPAVDGSAQAIRKVISGKTCRGVDVVTFGESAAGLAGTFKRVGRPAGSYSVGYGTILIRREQDVHGHVASVSPHDRMLYLSTGTYHCGI